MREPHPLAARNNGDICPQTARQSYPGDWGCPGHWKGNYTGKSVGLLQKAKIESSLADNLFSISDHVTISCPQKCLKEGAEVIATDVNVEKLQELKKEQPTVQVDRLDVTSGEEVGAIFKKYGNINVLFNCAG